MPSSDWQEPFIKYLTTIDVSVDKNEMECLIHRSKHYVLVDGKLMRKNAKEELLQSASLRKKEWHYFKKSTLDPATTTQPLEV